MRNDDRKKKGEHFPVLLTGILLAAALLLGASCGRVDGSGMPADGTYVPSAFTWSGGSGKTTITCPLFTVNEGKISAQIVFDSAFYEYVKVGEETFDPVHEGGTSVFTVPLPLNREVPLIGCTTAMSSPHEITYTVGVWYGEEPPAGADEPEEEASDEPGDAAKDEILAAESYEAPVIAGLTLISELPRTYADCFRVYYYSGGYKVLLVPGSARYFLVPEGAAVPEGLEPDSVIIHSSKKIYMAATAVMSLFARLDSVDRVAFSAEKSDGWTIASAKKAMEDGQMLYAGKYSEPDYELLLSQGCDLAIESTMILHAPKVQEMLTRLGIPVLIDYSSHEEHPLGRTEWIRFYGALLDREEEADAWFCSQEEMLKPLSDLPETQKTVAVFYLANDGTAVVRSADDYIASMVRLAGGRYAFEDMVNPAGSGPSVKLSMEEFYATAADADFLIYNGTIDNQVKSVADLLEKDRLFADFAAVKNGGVWLLGRDLYQATDTNANMVWDLSLMLTGGGQEEMTFLQRLE